MWIIFVELIIRFVNINGLLMGYRFNNEIIPMRMDLYKKKMAKLLFDHAEFLSLFSSPFPIR